MTQLAVKWMSVEEFLTFEAGEAWRHELIDGAPVAMTGASNRHDTVVVNMLAGLHARLRGRKCRPATADTAVVLPSGNVRRPDVLVDCSGKMEGVTAHEPTAIVEVLSPSSRITDFTVKFRDYTALDTLQTYVIVDQDRPDVVVYTRTPENRWEVAVASGIEASITFASLGVDLPLAEIYDRVTFEEVSATG